MDAYFGRVANVSLPQVVQAPHNSDSAASHLHALLDASCELDLLSASIPDPFAGHGPRHIQSERVHANLVQGLARSGRVLAKSGHAPATATQVLANSAQGCAEGTGDDAKPSRTALTSEQDCTSLTRVHINSAAVALHTGESDPGQKQARFVEQAGHTGHAISTSAASYSNTGALSRSNACSGQSGEPCQGSSHQLLQQQAGVPQHEANHSSLTHLAPGIALPQNNPSSAQEGKQCSAASSVPEAAQAMLVAPAPNFRHGLLLRQAAAEAAAVAAGQAARAESAVRASTPPTIAFNSKAAQHAMAATEAAAAAASLAGVAGISPEALFQDYAACNSRAGRLHASAPASPMHPSKPHTSVLRRACHGLWTAVGRRTHCSTDLAAVMASHHVGCLNSEEDESYNRQMHQAGVLRVAASVPSSPVSIKHSASQLWSQGPSQSQHGQVKYHAPDLQRTSWMEVQSSGHAEGTDLVQKLCHTGRLQTDNMKSQDLLLRHKVHEEPPRGSPQQGGGVQGGRGRCHEQQDQVQGEDIFYQQQEEERQPREGEEGLRCQQAEEEDPFIASTLFPAYAELASSVRPVSFGPLTDCTNQLGSAQHQATQHQDTQTQATQRVSKPQKSRARQHGVHRSQPAAELSKDSGFAFRPCAKTRDGLVRSTAVIPDISSLQRHGLACSASGAVAELTSLTEEEFWQAARADLLDTAETVRHKSRLQICSIVAVSPGGMPQAALLGRSQLMTPQAELPGDAKCGQLYGITPLLGILVLTLLTSELCTCGRCCVLCFKTQTSF